MKKIFLMLVVIGLMGCSSTYMGKMNDSSRRSVIVDGYKINVIKKDNVSYEAFGGETFDFDAIKLKKAQILAIEKISGCKVTDSEYSGPFVRTLYAHVKC